MVKKKTLLVLFLLFLTALFLRLFQLGTNPEALNWDEAALGYNSFSILKTGADEYGHEFPLVLRSFDDYKPAVYSYFSIPFIYLWGLTIFSTRFVSAFFGSLMVFSMYIFVKNIFSNKNAGMFAALFTTFAPVFLFYSRIAMEANLCLSIFTFGLAFITYKGSYKRFVVGLILLLLSAYTYHSARYLVPVIVLVSIVRLDYLTKGKKILTLAIFGLLYLPIIFLTFNPLYNARFTEVSILTNSKVLTGSNIKISGFSIIPENIIRIYFYISDLVGRYLSYFNPLILFFRSPSHDSYTVREVGSFNLFELPFWILGVYSYLKNVKKINPIFRIGLVLAALPAVFTVDWFSPLRAILLWPFFIGLTAYGLSKAVSFSGIKPNLLLTVCLLGWAYYAVFITEIVFVYKNYANYGDFQYGFAQSVPYVNKLISEGKYDNVVIDTPHGQPHIFYLFFSSYPPDLYQKETVWRDTDYSARVNFNFGPYTFRDIYWPKDRNVNDTLFVGDLSSLPTDQIANTTGAKILKDFNTPDGNVAVRVVQKD